MTSPTTYAQRQARGFCGSCGVRKPPKPFTRCLRCRQNEQRARTARYTDRKKHGSCVQCGERVVHRHSNGEPMARCPRHRLLHQKRQRARMVAQAIKKLAS
jgi:hypothetical protein